MQPTAAKAVHGWLQTAGDKGIATIESKVHEVSSCRQSHGCVCVLHAERDVAVRLFSSLGQRQGGGGVRKRTYSEPGTPNGRPPSRRPIPPVGAASQSTYG